MLTQNPPPQRSHSPEEFYSTERKRKRKALSCYTCRLRKLGCDRTYPSCSRCRKSGQANTCTYESGSFECKAQEDGEKPGVTTTFPAVEIDESRLKLPSTPSIHRPIESAPDSYASKATSQAQRISHLESRLAVLETHRPSAVWQCLEEVDPVAKSSEDTEKRAITNSATILTSPRPESSAETILFRGANYKTEYYGGSNPTSLVAHVRVQLVFLSRSTKYHSFLSFDHL